MRESGIPHFQPCNIDHVKLPVFFVEAEYPAKTDTNMFIFPFLNCA